ncbi:RHS repeat-associated core domain-containing protein, partial [Elizabethkingia anophelis]
QSDGTLRRYSYQYDGVNRLKEGNYWDNAGAISGSYAERLNYDLNGNITGLQRTGQGAGVMDQLGYTYDQSGNSNKLIRVNDASGNAAGYPVGGNTIAYDINGNMVNHLDKGISNIAYNYLNLPSSITASIGNTDYVYRADGTKVRKVFGGKTTDYLDGFQYENGVLQFVPTSEGYYDVVKNKYIYNYTDHLGNVRLSYTKGASGGAEIIEENNYYPFGLKHQGYNSNSLANSAYQYKYNGKELQETGMYDYGARMYMPELGRWGVVDPLAEKMTRHSPYNYAFNNPIRFIDSDGRQGTDWFWDSKKKAFTYDASLTSAEQFNTLKDQGLVEGQYLGKEGQFNVVYGNETIGKVALYNNGDWLNMSSGDANTFDYHSADGPERTRGQYFTNLDSSRNWGVQILDKPFSIGIGGELTAGVGAGFEIGYFSGNYDSGAYLNLFKSAGLNVGLGGAYNEYTSQEGYGPLTTANFGGNYWNVSGGVGPFAGNYGETTKEGNGNVSIGGASISSGIWNFLKRPKLSAGISAQAGTTYIIKSKKIRENEK